MCGIAGVFNNDHASQYVFLQIYSLQHRGQESSGIASFDGSEIRVVRKSGRVLESINQEHLDYLKGNVAIGHVRYSTAGDSGGVNAQPIVRETPFGTMAVVHNGNITNFPSLKRKLAERGVTFEYSSDSELFLALLEDESLGEDLISRFLYSLTMLEGAYSILMIAGGKLIAARDPYGFRPLLIGNREGTIVFASQSCVLVIVEGQIIGEVEPGEVVVVDDSGMKSYFPFGKRRISMCIFEFVYFSRPDSYIFGEYAYRIRKELGKKLALEDDTVADFVVPVPDSGVVPALGYSEVKGIPFELGLIRNHYVGRSFIEPTEELRNLKVLMKLSPNRSVIEGKSIVVVDDSLVRGTTSKRIVTMLRRAGAREIHLRIASPPVIGPCYYGIDTPTKEELIANRMSVDGIREFIGVDSLRYLSLEGLRSCVEDHTRFCDACFSNEYPTVVEKIEVLRKR